MREGADGWGRRAFHVAGTLGVIGVALLVFVLIAVKIDRPLAHRLSWSPVAPVLDLLTGLVPELFTRRNLQEAWYTREPRLVYGYVDSHSVFPGQSFHVMLSVGLDQDALAGYLELARLGYQPETGHRSVVWTSPPLVVEPQPMLDTAASIGSAWPAAAAIRADEGWSSGFYDLRFVVDDGRVAENVAFVVVKDAAVEGDVLVKIATNTYQAYNLWGGHNLYRSLFLGRRHRGQIVSFDRPIGHPTRHTFFRWEYPYVVWLEELAQKEGFEVHYATNFDASTDRRFTQNYDLLISVGHDEYWTGEEFEHTWERIFRLGKNTLFLGANTAYWQVRYADVNAPPSSPRQGRQMVCFKSPGDPIGHRLSEAEADLHVTAMFREQGRNPETQLMGVGYQYYLDGPQRFPYFVVDSSLWLFEGTGYRTGDSIGDLVGHEWDNRDPEGDGARLYTPGVSKHGELAGADPTLVLQGEPIDAKGRKGLAEAVLFESAAGARVFSSGTTDWGRGMSLLDGEESQRFRQLNRNLVLSFLNRGE
jgi:hypothetical protein